MPLSLTYHLKLCLCGRQTGSDSGVTFPHDMWPDWLCEPQQEAGALATAQSSWTPLWAAPEVVRLEKGTIKADIWSYGICIFELVSPCLGGGRQTEALYRKVENIRNKLKKCECAIRGGAPGEGHHQGRHLVLRHLHL